MRFPSPRSSIRLRLLLASTVVQVVLLSLLIFNSVRLMNEATEASVEVMVGQNASMLHALATAYGEQRRFEAMQDVLGELLVDAEEGLVYVRIVDADGVSLLTAGMPGMLELPDPERAPWLKTSEGAQHLLHVRTPLLLEGNRVGFLQFGVSASVLVLAQQAIFRQGAMIALAEILLTFLLLSSIGYLLTRNLRRLLDGSLALADGRLAHRIPEQGNDELSRLARRFNLMAERLQARIGELDQTARELHRSEERYALAMKGANDGLWDWDIPAKTLYVSPRFSEIFGLPTEASEISQYEIPKRMNPTELDARHKQLVAHLKGETEQFKCELQVRLPDGRQRWVLVRGVALRNDDGNAYRMAGSISDIHQQKLAEAQLMHDAFHDRLTGLPNRALLLEHLDSALGRRQRNPRFSFAVLTINLQRFHLVNDSLGHAAGDDLLREVGARIVGVIRRGDIAARVGGDQFATLVTDIGTEEEGLRIAEALRAAVCEPVMIAGAHTFYPKVHIGVALAEQTVTDPEALLRDSDNALHEAKRGTDSSVAVFHASMHSRALHTIRLEADLRAAIGEGKIDVHLQPIVSLANGRIASFEALARWTHPQLGMVPPSEFIPIAESRGLIQALALSTLDKVCDTLLNWQSSCPERADLPAVSINLSAVQLTNPMLADELVDRIRARGLETGLIRFEITESLLTDAKGPGPVTLARLRDAGVKVMIDDFGTGYSALNYLHTIPCDLIKFDGSFINAIEHDERLRAIVLRSIELAHDLGMEVVAEWVERDEQASILRQLGCDFGQGYLFGRPALPGATPDALASPPSPTGVPQ